MPRMLWAALWPATWRRAPGLPGKGRRIQAVQISDVLPVPQAADGDTSPVHRDEAWNCIGWQSSTCTMPEAMRRCTCSRWRLPPMHKQKACCRISRKVSFAACIAEGGRRQGVLFEPTQDPGFWQGLLRLVRGRHHYHGTSGELRATTTPVLRQLLGSTGGSPATFANRDNVLAGQEVGRAAAAVYGDRLAFKLFRRLEAGISPGLELEGYLTEHGFAHVPALAGTLAYTGPTAMSSPGHAYVVLTQSGRCLAVYTGRAGALFRARGSLAEQPDRVEVHAAILVAGFACPRARRDAGRRLLSFLGLMSSQPRAGTADCRVAPGAGSGPR